jgi:M6 family metalloprotease-like protein
MKRIHRARSLITVSLLLIAISAFAAPHNGDVFSLAQPDGSLVECRVFGDEYYQDVETPDGYTLVRDPATGWICYAELSPDGMTYISTGTVYDPKAPTLPATRSGAVFKKRIRIKKEAVAAAVRARKAIIDATRPEDDSETNSSGSTTTDGTVLLAPPATSAMSGTYTGLTILIDFPDKKSSITKQQIDDFCNQTGYTGFSNNGSIKDYFQAISDNALTYQNRITAFVTTNNNFSYYDQNCDYCKVAELLNEVLNKLKNSGFDFSGLSTKNSQFVALNFYYAGSPTQGWAKGLWPHQGWLNGSFSVNGIRAVMYQLSNIGNELSLSTFTHENGHMLLGWPDVYAYDDHDNGVGYYEEGTNKKNPSMRNPYFRYLKGWCRISDMSNAQAGTVYSLAANTNNAVFYSNKSDGRQFYLIEAIRRTGRNASLPDEGLAIWHVNLDGDNTVSSKPNLISIEQADGKFDIENKVNNGGAGDLFHAGDKTTFNDNTNPSAKWTDGSASAIDINSVSAVADSMTFTYKSGTLTTPDPTAGPQTPAPTTVNVIRGDVNGSGTIDIVDALLTAKYYVGSNPENFNSTAADVNCDGVVNIVDALRIAQYYVGLINSFC